MITANFLGVWIFRIFMVVKLKHLGGQMFRGPNFLSQGPVFQSYCRQDSFQTQNFLYSLFPKIAFVSLIYFYLCSPEINAFLPLFPKTPGRASIFSVLYSSFDDEGYGAVNADVSLLTAGFILVFVFVILVLGRFNLMEHKVCVRNTKKIASIVFFKYLYVLWRICNRNIMYLETTKVHAPHGFPFNIL